MPDRELHGDHHSTDRLLGELIAEVRAVKHNQNNAAMELKAVGKQTEPIRMLVDQIKELKVEQEKHHFRLAVLEADKNRREGAVGLVEWIGRHWPFSVLIAALAAWVAWANDRVG
jgi:hypothetical protein